MSGLAEVVRALAARPGVVSVVLVSADGLPIDQAGMEGDHEAIAALAGVTVRQAQHLAVAAQRGELATVVVEGERGPVLLAPVSGGSWLAVTVDQGTNFGQLLFELRRHGPALAALL